MSKEISGAGSGDWLCDIKLRRAIRNLGPMGKPTSDPRPASACVKGVTEDLFDRWWFSERWDLLLEPAQQRLARARAGEGPKATADAVTKLAIVIQNLRGAEQAVSLCWEAYRLRKRIGDPEETAIAAGLLVWNLALATDLSRAIHLIPRAIRAYRAAGMDLDGFLLLAELGDELLNLNRFHAAMLIFEQALLRAPHRYPCWGKARVLEAMVSCCEQMGEPLEGIEMAREAAAALEDLGFSAEAAWLQVREARLRFIMNEREAAIGLLRRAGERLRALEAWEMATEVWALLQAWGKAHPTMGPPPDGFGETKEQDHKYSLDP